jgi:hypothetical protein
MIGASFADQFSKKKMRENENWELFERKMNTCHKTKILFHNRLELHDERK